MEPVTTRLGDDTYQYAKDRAEAENSSVSAIVRELAEKGMEYDDLKRENARLETRVRKVIEQRDEHTELVEYVDEQREIERDERARRNAPVWRRAKWWVFGRADGDRAESSRV